MNKISLKRKWTDSSVIVMVAAVLMLVSLFVPYAVARSEYREVLQALPAQECLEGTDITYHSTISISVVEYIKFNSQTGASMVWLTAGLTVAMAAAALLSGVFALLKKPVPVILFDLMAFASFFAYNNVFMQRQRGLPLGPTHGFGVGYYLFYVVVVVSLAGGIWMLREQKAQEQEETEE